MLGELSPILTACGASYALGALYTRPLMDLHWLPYPQRITYKLCMIMFKCLRGTAPAYLIDYCTSTYFVPGRLAFLNVFIYIFYFHT